MSHASGIEHLRPFLPGLESVLADPDISEVMINGPPRRLDRAGGPPPRPSGPGS